MFDLVCLSFQGNSLTDEMRMLLMEQACRLLRSGKKFQVFRTDFCEGKISTKGERFTLGYISGTRFAAEIESERGNTKAEVLIDARVMEMLEENDLSDLSVQYKTVARPTYH